MLRVDQRSVGRLGRVIPLAGVRFPARILRRGDQFEPLAFQLRIEFLPARQIEAAASPGGPGQNEYFLAPEFGKPDGASLSVGNGELRGDPGV